MSDRDKGEYSLWLSFFRAAGIPSGFDTKYACIFDDNRMRFNMLLDLNKECLRDMGITAMGDIITILKHSKRVHEESKEKAHGPTTKLVSAPPPQRVNITAPNSRMILPTTTTAKPVTPLSDPGIGQNKVTPNSSTPTSIQVIEDSPNSVNTKPILKKTPPLSLSTERDSAVGRNDSTITRAIPVSSTSSRPQLGLSSFSSRKRIIIPTRTSSSESESSSDEASEPSRGSKESKFENEPRAQVRMRTPPGNLKVSIRRSPEPESSSKNSRLESFERSRASSTSSCSTAKGNDKKTVFDRLGESKVSSTSEPEPKEKPKLKVSFDPQTFTPRGPLPKGVKPSVFDRLGVPRTPPKSALLKAEKELGLLGGGRKPITSRLSLPTPTSRSKSDLDDRRSSFRDRDRDEFTNGRNRGSSGVQGRSSGSGFGRLSLDSKVDSGRLSRLKSEINATLTGSRGKVPGTGITRNVRKTAAEGDSNSVSKRLPSNYSDSRDPRPSTSTASMRDSFTKKDSSTQPRSKIAIPDLEDGQVIRTIRVPSANKGKVIVKRIIVKKVPKRRDPTPPVDDSEEDYSDIEERLAGY